MKQNKNISVPELIFWPGSLGTRGFKEIIKAAEAGNYHSMAISPLMIKELYLTGYSYTDINAEAETHNIRLVELDGVSSWAPVWFQKNSLPSIRERFDISSEQCLDMAEALGIKTILTVGAFDYGTVEKDVLIESFIQFCDSAATRKMHVELEFVPFWGIPDLTCAWDIVSQADRTNSSLLIDTWHLHKGTKNLENDLNLLKNIPGERLQGVQLADAKLVSQNKELYKEGRFRMFPGDGELAIDSILQIMREKGCLKRIGTEIFGEAIDNLSSFEAGHRSADSIFKLLAK